MLVFAKGKPLGAEGLNWLKIHLINLTGFKKRSSNKDRLAFADEIMDDILDSADKPLTVCAGRQQFIEIKLITQYYYVNKIFVQTSVYTPYL